MNLARPQLLLALCCVALLPRKLSERPLSRCRFVLLCVLIVSFFVGLELGALFFLCCGACFALPWVAWCRFAFLLVHLLLFYMCCVRFVFSLAFFTVMCPALWCVLFFCHVVLPRLRCSVYCCLLRFFALLCYVSVASCCFGFRWLVSWALGFK